jgi:hypothetical protein
MRKSAKLGLTALMATLLLVAGVSTASARRFLVFDQNIRVTWTSLEFINTFFIRCLVTLEGSFHARTIPKISRTLIGAITRAIAKEEECTNGRIRFFSLPWHLTYEGFAGSLPGITSAFFLFSRFNVEATVPGICTGEYGNATDNITLRAGIDFVKEVTGLEPVTGRNTATRTAGGAFCPASGTLAGRGNVMRLGTTTRIKLELI